MSVSRNRSLKELANQSELAGTNPAVRASLEVYSTAEVDAAIAAIDLSPYATVSTVASASGALDNRIDGIDTTIVNITGDIADLDLSLTAKIQSDCVQSDGITGADTTVIGYLEVTIDGTTYRLARV